jgi:prophage regulatory protein
MHTRRRLSKVAKTLNRMLRLPEVVELTGLSPTTLWRRERNGEFPRRRRLGSTLVAWRSDEVAEWMERLPLATGDRDDPATVA